MSVALWARVGVALTVAVMVSPTAALLVGAPPPHPSAVPVVVGPHPSAAPAVPPAALLPPSADDRLSAIESAARADAVPLQMVHPPDLGAADPAWKGQVQPTYAGGPAPMGISDLGLRVNSTGNLTPYVYDTSSVWGSVTLDRAQSVYVDGDGPDTFDVQLNAVVTNVTIQGHGGREFWAQEFVSYTPSTETLAFGDNLWNFSAPGASLYASAFAPGGKGGTVVAPYFYYDVGPTVPYVVYPFTLDLYLNASLVNHLPSVSFGYVVQTANATVTGSFDHVVFNTTSTTQAPVFQANGTGVDPFGLPNDLELVLVGDGAGDTTTFFAINATAALRYWNASARAYLTVPAAYDAGSDTGETSTGILPVYRPTTVGGPPSVTLVTGPSFVRGLWNVSQTLDGAREFIVNQHPQNAFLFISPGTSFNASEAEWVPTIHFYGATRSVFFIPNDDNETLEWLLADRTPLNFSVTPTLPGPNVSSAITESLAVNASAGSYTPLLAWGNGELAAISPAGENGTSGNPFVLDHRPTGSLEPVFGQLNDFGFPVFAGVLLINTTDDVQVAQPPDGITYGAWQLPLLERLGLPSTNVLQLEFWNVSSVVVLNSTDLGGWLPSGLGFFPAGEVVFWGSSGNLVSRDTFYDQGVALVLYGGSGNTVWGDTFLAAAARPTFDNGSAPVGVLEAESGDLLYNNYFDVPQPAVNPASDPVSCQSVCHAARYDDTWNVPRETANASVTVLGVALTGSIVRTSYQGGNYWSNYGTSGNPFWRLPYNDSGRINGGDYVPLVLSPVYNVTFVESGLAAGLAWNVTTLGVTSAVTGARLLLAATNGTYPYSVTGPAGYVAPAASTFSVDGTNATVGVTFDERFSEVVQESGLVDGWGWSVTFTPTGGSSLGPVTANSSGLEATAALPNGSYDYAVLAYGYTADPASGSVTVDGAPPGLAVHFAAQAILTVTATGLAAGTPWTVTVTQGSVSSTETGIGDGSLVFTVLEIGPGAFSWRVAASNYTATPARGSGTSPGPVTEGVAFLPTTSSSSTSPVSLTLLAAVALAVLAAIGFALFALERRKARRPPAAPASTAAGAAAGTTGAAAAAAGPAPWEEGPSDAEQTPSFGRRP